MRKSVEFLVAALICVNPFSSWDNAYQFDCIGGQLLENYSPAAVKPPTIEVLTMFERFDAKRLSTCIGSLSEHLHSMLAQTRNLLAYRAK
jgi:hypothetical protein